jgi:hypothetical protein
MRFWLYGTSKPARSVKEVLPELKAEKLYKNTSGIESTK